MKAQYFLLNGHLNVIRVIGVDYAYLNHETGAWMSDNSLFAEISGCGGDADTKEISREKAREWIENNAPHLDAASLTVA